MHSKNILKTYVRHCLVIVLLLCTGSGVAIARGSVPESVIDALEWRMIGPYRGGRVTTVTGVAGKPNLY